MLGDFLESAGYTAALAFMFSRLPVMAALSRAFMDGKETMRALNSAECWGPIRIRSRKADSCRLRAAIEAEDRAFSSSRKEMRMCSRIGISWEPTKTGVHMYTTEHHTTAKQCSNACFSLENQYDAQPC